MDALYDCRLTLADGTEKPMAEYRDKVLLIVNTASKCGFTPQFAGLEQLHRKFADRGLAVIGFPCNQFGAQDPGSIGEIVDFCHSNYDVSFELAQKTRVNGPQTHPLYRLLKKAAPGLAGSQAIKWNFTKFLVDRNGEVRGRFAPMTPPHKIEDAVGQLL